MSRTQFADSFSSLYQPVRLKTYRLRLPVATLMITSQQAHTLTRSAQVREITSPGHRLDEHIIRALNKIKKPSSAEEITELLNHDLGPGDRPFQVKEISAWLKDARDTVLNLYWLETRPRR